MKKLVFTMSIFIFLSCNKETKNLTPNFKDFIYVNLNLRETNSLKFSGNDTLYLQKRFSKKPDENYIAILNRKVKDSLIKRINKLNFEKYKPNYIAQNIDDENSQVLIICRNKKPEFISINEKIGPSEIRVFSSWFEKSKTKLKFVKTKEYVHFWNNKEVVPAPAPPKIVKNIKFKE